MWECMECGRKFTRHVHKCSKCGGVDIDVASFSDSVDRQDAAHHEKHWLVGKSLDDLPLDAQARWKAYRDKLLAK